ncbi:MAG: SRPBCC domain-containing protein [Novosphingobium sp.]
MEQQADRAAAQVERVSDRELVVTRMVAAPPRLVYRAWSEADLFRQWWVPASFGITLLSCAMDVRTGGTYRLEFGHPASDQPMAFFGTYLEAVPDEKIVWTNEESPDGAVTTVTLAAQDGGTLVRISNLFPTREALDAEIESGATGGLDEQFAALDALLAGNA